MKYLKYLALFLALAMFLTLGVACNSGDEGGETTAPPDGATTAAPFIVELTITAIDENGEKVEILDEEEVQYNGLKPTTELTVFDIVEDYCADNDVEYTPNADGRVESIGGYSVAEGGFQWTYSVNGKKLTEYDVAIANGSTITVTMVVVE